MSFMEFETEADQIEFELWLQERYQIMRQDASIDPKMIDVKRSMGYHQYLKSSKGRVENILNALQYESLMRNLGTDLEDEEVI